MKHEIDRHADELEIDPNDIHDENQLERQLAQFTELLKYCPKRLLNKFWAWIDDNGWSNYDGIDRWVTIKGLKVVETKELFELFKIEVKLTPANPASYIMKIIGENDTHVLMQDGKIVTIIPQEHVEGMMNILGLARAAYNVMNEKETA